MMTLSPIAATQTSEDTDNDGLSNSEETDLGSDPNDKDTDNDGLFDGKEIDLRLDLKNKDTDSDGVTDKTEIEQGTDPSSPDNETPIQTTEDVLQTMGLDRPLAWVGGVGVLLIIAVLLLMRTGLKDRL